MAHLSRACSISMTASTISIAISIASSLSSGVRILATVFTDLLFRDTNLPPFRESVFFADEVAVVVSDADPNGYAQKNEYNKYRIHPALSQP